MKGRLAVSLVLLPLLAPAQLLPSERKGIDDALFVGNMTERDLQYERKPFSDKYRIPLVDLAIDQPLAAADRLMRFHASGSAKSLLSLLRTARTQGLADPSGLTIVTTPHAPDAELSRLPEPLRGPVQSLVDAIRDSTAIVKKALSRLSPDETRSLIESLPLYANEEPSIKFSFSQRTDYDAKRILDLIDRIDLRAIRASAELLAEHVEATLPKLRALAKTLPAVASAQLRLDGLRVDIGGQGDDVHESKDAVLTIDLGGNDVYRGRIGAGIGYSSVFIDLGGNDLFEVSDVNLGAGILGVGLAYDLGGHDIFRCRSLCLGAGLAGVGGFYHDGGNDSYEAVSLAEGFGEFGIGISCDTAGRDRYEGNLNVQGAARTGGVGWLVDQSGDDVYRAGGLILNSPLFEKVHYSNAQGYGSGYREDTGGTSGGIGMLTDLGGHDTYIGETYCQGASYWFAIGSLYDAGGNDTYLAYHYAQASAMHMTAAYLFDLAGDDAYICKMGAAHAIGHDYGVAFLLDRSGMDLYAAHDSRPAIGSANGLAIFVDGEGDDRYFGPPGIGLPARGSGSLALFCDLGGSDTYAEGLADGQATTRESWAVAIDESGTSASSGGSATGPAKPTPTPGSLQKPSDTEMEAIYRKATQWGVGTAQQEVADNVARLVGIGKPALQWMIDRHLKTADRLQIRAFVAVIGGVGAEGRALIAAKVASDDLDEARVALSIVNDAGIKEAGPYLPSALKKPALARMAARTAGSVGSAESVPDLMALAGGSDSLTALNAMVSLIALADPSSLSTGQALLASPELPIRKAAIQLVAKFPADALRIGTSLSGVSDEHLARTGIEILARLGTPESLDVIGRLLATGTNGVRIQALLALSGRVPDAYRAAVVDARKDPDPIVREVAARVDFGR